MNKTAKYRNGSVKLKLVTKYVYPVFTRALILDLGHIMINKKHFHLFTSLFLSYYWWCWTISNDAKCRY